MKKIYFFTLSFLIIHTAQAQFTTIPDSNFEQALINLGYDDVIDGQVLTANIQNVVELDIPNLGIQDLTGIEDFNSLTALWIEYNNMNSIDISQNIALELLVLDGNPISNIDISNNINLYVFAAPETLLNSIDTSMNVNLDILDVEYCNITSLDLSNNSNLTLLVASGNQLTDIDLSSNILLEQVFIYENQLTAINLENHPNLLDLFVDFNFLTELDLSANSLLEELDCSVNPNLNFINIKNGNNALLVSFDAIEIAPNACIQVDDAAAATAGTVFPYNLWVIDPTAIFSENCALSAEDFTFQNLDFYPNPTTDKLTFVNTIIASFEIYDAKGSVVLKNTNLNDNSIEVASLSPGMYFIKVYNDKSQTQNIRFVIK